MKQVDSISVEELTHMAEKMYGDLVKAVVDVNRRIVVFDAAMHSDEEQYLPENGSSQDCLWGINLYPDDYGTEDFIEFDSMINIRPQQNNRSRSVEDPDTRNIIISIVNEVVHE